MRNGHGVGIWCKSVTFLSQLTRQSQEVSGAALGSEPQDGLKWALSLTYKDQVGDLEPS